MNEKSIKKNLGSQTNWSRLLQEDDADIDYSDSPATTQEFWRDAEIFTPAHKIHLSLRLDEDVINFFKQRGRGYQSRINAVLKAYVNAHANSSKRV